jgi:hypothetical protein
MPSMPRTVRWSPRCRRAIRAGCSRAKRAVVRRATTIAFGCAGPPAPRPYWPTPTPSARSSRNPTCMPCAKGATRSPTACLARIRWWSTESPARASRCGRPTRAARAWWGPSTNGTAAATRCACATPRASGRSSSRASPRATSTSSNCSARTAPCCPRRPTPMRSPPNCDPGPPAVWRTCRSRWRCRRSAPQPTAAMRRSRSTRCTPHRGGTPPAASRPGTNSPPNFPTTRPRWASPMSN